LVLATAVLVAAGSGNRLGAGGPKALAEVGGRPLAAWALDALAAAESVGRVVVAAPPGHEDDVRALAGPDAAVVTGGAARSESVALALAEVKTDLVVVHDAARPLASPELFDEVVALLAGDGTLAGVVAAAPVADTLKRADAHGGVLETLDRNGLWAVQTPQAFRRRALLAALGSGKVAEATDDASLVEAAGGQVAIHPWGRPNPKLTTPADLTVIEALLAARG
jgi:2-C-methyl-D-erythritol 4-phosphate cytidylyltransferase